MATTRRRGLNLADKNQVIPENNKRALEKSPNKANKRKRPAFGDITNKELARQITKEKQAIKKVTGQKGKAKTVIVIPKSKSKPVTSSQPDSQGSNQSDDVSYDVIELSQESSQSGSSQDSAGSQLSQTSSQSECSVVEAMNAKNLTLTAETREWEDVDAKYKGDIYSVPDYAADIFEYYKERELKYIVPNYMTTQQPDLGVHMRATLVDWLVEVQENFELNHETLYLAVKMVDHYLSRKKVSRERLQLLGATAVFIACKFDERCPPLIDDFIYICDDAYLRHEFIHMEMEILRVLGFCIGFPLSYRFLRRFSRCAGSSMPTLTLARYLLESSLLDYDLVRERDSKVAAACMLLALWLTKTGEWNATMVHYTGYEASDLKDLVKKLNCILSAPPTKHLNTVRNKYSHQLFHEVAKTPALTIEELSSRFPDTSV